MGYSIVKYMPSDAGLPSAYAPGISAEADYQAYSLILSRNRSNLLNP
jgi:hypothetical protein